jgi:hypothetical protein
VCARPLGDRASALLAWQQGLQTLLESMPLGSLDRGLLARLAQLELELLHSLAVGRRRGCGLGLEPAPHLLAAGELRVEAILQRYSVTVLAGVRGPCFLEALIELGEAAGGLGALAGVRGPCFFEALIELGEAAGGLGVLALERCLELVIPGLELRPGGAFLLKGLLGLGDLAGGAPPQLHPRELFLGVDRALLRLLDTSLGVVDARLACLPFRLDPLLALALFLLNTRLAFPALLLDALIGPGLRFDRMLFGLGHAALELRPLALQNRAQIATREALPGLVGLCV